MKSKNQIVVVEVNKYKGFTYWVTLNRSGFFCAYILVPEEHKLYGLNYDEVDIDCHGGLTYNGSGYQFVGKDYFVNNKIEKFPLYKGWVFGMDLHTITIALI